MVKAARFLLLSVVFVQSSGVTILRAAPPDEATVTLAPGVTLELVPAGSDDGKFLVSPRPISKAQFGVFAMAASYRTEAERGTSGGFGYDPATGKTIQKPGFSWRSPGFDQAPGDPVVDVTRDDALAFLAWASRKAGRTLSLPSARRWELAVAAYPPAHPTGPGTSVREWTSDLSPETPGQPVRVILRGASWLQDAAKPDPAQLSHAASPGSRQPDFGFRACTEASAATAPAATKISDPALVPAAGLASAMPVIPATAASPAPPRPASDQPAAVSTGRSVTGWLVILVPVVVVFLLLVALARGFLGLLAGSRGASNPAPYPQPAGPGQPSAVAVAGGIQVRAEVEAGTPLSLSWTGGPANGLPVTYRPGPQGMFIPVPGVVRDPSVALLGGDGIVPAAAVTPVTGGFQVSGAVPHGTAIHASWTDDAGRQHTGSAPYDASAGYTFFATSQPPVNVAVSLRPLPAATLPPNPPPGATRLPPGAYAQAPNMTVHTHQNNDGFWTGFWMSHLLQPSHPNYQSSHPYYGGSHFSGSSGSSYTGTSHHSTPDDQPGGNVPATGALFGPGEPPAYH